MRLDLKGIEPSFFGCKPNVMNHYTTSPLVRPDGIEPSSSAYQAEIINHYTMDVFGRSTEN